MADMADTTTPEQMVSYEELAELEKDFDDVETEISRCDGNASYHPPNDVKCTIEARQRADLALMGSLQADHTADAALRKAKLSNSQNSQFLAART